MIKVERKEILDVDSYAAARATIRATVMEAKRRRRVHVGRYLTFLFENAATVRYQIQEMIRAERVVREVDIRHEIATYNAILGAPGELSCCLLIEIDDPLERARRLREWRTLTAHVYLRCAGGATVRPRADPDQSDGDRISAVQYLKFCLDDWRPVAVGCDFPGLHAETPLTEEQREALDEDLAQA
jgi:hypothetical protein